ncbi:DUF1120 domain-containing protein [Burkholderia cepacia]|uniref:DUF1120 domain-containing protein n=1 Tax=Burkholderia cepacia GG4 TaxID=1009846 RepID=A0A9W3PAY3_BURCE|nr:DUF1120 domain-containing protein [Burkholderia cepacia]AFQ50026.1 hypothetical protein GEM_3636 [Burkholderia cepacia GG4]
MHRKHLLAPSLLASALLLSAGQALAGADLSVSGRIQPGACSLALGNGGTIDLGTISPKDLKEDEATVFDQHEISLGIHCQAPTKVAFRALDNRAGTALDGYWFGLGASGGKSVGRYSLVPRSRVGDGAELVHLMKSDGGAWKVPPGGSTATTWGIDPSVLSSWAEPGQTLPQAFRNISSRLGFYIQIAPTKDLDLSQQVPIDGSATMELIYL